jgi:hypothetical protein
LMLPEWRGRRRLLAAGYKHPRTYVIWWKQARISLLWMYTSFAVD